MSPADYQHQHGSTNRANKIFIFVKTYNIKKLWLPNYQENPSMYVQIKHWNQEIETLVSMSITSITHYLYHKIIHVIYARYRTTDMFMLQLLTTHVPKTWFLITQCVMWYLTYLDEQFLFMSTTQFLYTWLWHFKKHSSGKRLLESTIALFLPIIQGQFLVYLHF